MREQKVQQRITRLRKLGRVFFLDFCANPQIRAKSFSPQQSNHECIRTSWKATIILTVAHNLISYDDGYYSYCSIKTSSSSSLGRKKVYSINKVIPSKFLFFWSSVVVVFFFGFASSLVRSSISKKEKSKKEILPLLLPLNFFWR